MPRGRPYLKRHAGLGVGANLSPPLAWSGIPPDAAELVLIVQDPDAPLRRPVVHLIAMGITPTTQAMREGMLTPHANPTITYGRGAFGVIGYAGPRPIPAHGPHRYAFQLFALKRKLALPVAPDLAAVTACDGGCCHCARAARWQLRSRLIVFRILFDHGA